MKNGDKVLFVYDEELRVFTTLDGKYSIPSVFFNHSCGNISTQPEPLSALNEMSEQTMGIINGYEQMIETLNKSNVRRTEEIDDADARIDTLMAVIKEVIKEIKEK